VTYVCADVRARKDFTVFTAQIQCILYYWKHREPEFGACPCFIMVVAGQCTRPNGKSAIAKGVESYMLTLLS
jgi:hypothetical protein